MTSPHTSSRSWQGEATRATQPASTNSPSVDRTSFTGQSPIGSERGASPGATNKLAGSLSSLNSGSGTIPSDDSFRANIDSTDQSPASSTLHGTVDDMTGSSLLDPDNQEGIKARIERKRLEHERQRALQRQAFEEQMRMLERQQREEEANLLRQQKGPNAAQAPGATPQGRSVSGTNGPRGFEVSVVSAPVTPPFDAGKAAFAGAGSAIRSGPGPSPTHLGSGLNDANDTQDGLNGSNVPGLPPLNSARSVPPTRRTSRDSSLQPTPFETAAGNPNRRSLQGVDLTGSINRLSLGSGTSGAVGGVGADSDLQRGIAGQESRSGERLMPRRSGADQLAQPSASESGASGLTPVFNERFLFDDELDAEDSAFVKKYNLSDDDDKFPMLLRNDTFPGLPGGHLSSSSAALDLAPLSQTEAKHGRGPTVGANGSAGAGNMHQLSEWPQFESKLKADHLDRRGRSERNSPRLSAGAVGRSGALGIPSAGSVGSGLNATTRHGSIGPASPGQGGAGLGSFPASQGGAGDSISARGGREASAGAASTKSAFSPSGVPLSDSNVANLAAGGAASVERPRSGLSGFPLKSNNASSKSLGPFPSAPFDEEAPRGIRPSSAYFQAFGNGSGVNSAFAPAPGSTGPESLPSSDVSGRKGELDVNTRLEDLKGEIFTLCKDQHGCRYLQKKLEEGVAAYRDMIFAETFSHFSDLMTDPFGNYLCQKMLEFCTDEQRNLIVESVAGELVTISLNMHGTRAVQKTIDFLSTSRQIHSIILALSASVVTLIKDLNGNHVIQKCLNRLSSDENQFIYNAVAAHCVEVATHRHGCCVLQRCVDHASDKQRVQLVQEITYNALTLVQDPFGNYVVQYILDLNDARFTEAIVRQFIGNVCLLSVQKFSSNVIEKCIRVSDMSTRRQLIEELLNRARLEKLLRDSFANYVVQTALDYSEPLQRAQLVECIRPILPMIRNTPYGKRIQSKLQRENFDSAGAGPGAGGAAGPMGGMSVPYHVLQAAAQQQHLQAMAAMAAVNSGVHRPGMGAAPADFSGMAMNPYTAAAAAAAAANSRGGTPQMQRRLPPGMPGAAALPPPHQLYGPGGSPDVGGPAVAGRGAGAAALGRFPPPHMNPHLGHHLGHMGGPPPHLAQQVPNAGSGGAAYPNFASQGVGAVAGYNTAGAAASRNGFLGGAAGQGPQQQHGLPAGYLNPNAVGYGQTSGTF